MQQHNIEVSKTARYFSEGNPDANNIWIVLHGYGMLASQMIPYFDLIDKHTNYIIAPEGLSRFYWKGFDGNVVASWMTKEDRQDEITDYISYLNKLVLSLHLNGKTINVLGFSQGVATMSRWLVQCNLQFDKLVLWAGEPPADIDYAAISAKSNHMFFVYGQNDQFINEESLAKIKTLFTSQQCMVEFKAFEGKHELNATLVTELLT